MPEISVLMGVYNEKKKEYVAQAIESICRQTFQDFEFIICDDGSEKEFYDWLVQYCKKDHRIKILHTNRNYGLAAALNRCFYYSCGAFIARMDADDISKTDRLEKQITFLKLHPAYALVGCSAQLFGEQGVWGVRKPEEIPDKKSFLHTSPFLHPTVMMRRSVVQALHGYCESPKIMRAEDYDFFMRLYAAGYRGYNMQDVLFQYRQDRKDYEKRRYYFRIYECRVRFNGFQRLGIRKGNSRYVLKPLIAGMAPRIVMYLYHKKRFHVTAKSEDSR